MKFKLPDDPHVNKWVTGILVLLLLIGMWPAILNKGYYTWETRSDSKFYANCAENFLQDGKLTWSEIYPIALQKGKGAEMVFTSWAHPMMTATLASLFGLPVQEATIWGSSLSYIAILLFFFLLGLKWMKDYRCGLLLVSLAMMLPQSWEYAASGGTETLSQLGMLVGLGLSYKYSEKLNLKWMVITLVFLMLCCFIRPHNKFLYMASLLLVFKGTPRLRVHFVTTWLAGLLVMSLTSSILARQGDITFPYTFSFLVNTPAYPAHDIFRDYRGAFGWSDLWAEKEQLWEKVFVGLQLLKMYWSSWLPHLFLLLGLSIWGRARWLARMVLLVLLAGLFFAAMGHLVPRYWRIMEPVVLCVAAVHFLKDRELKTSLKWVMFYVALLVGGVMLRSHWHFGPPSSKLNRALVPPGILSQLPADGLLASDAPEKLIDRAGRRILWLPKTTDQLDRINIEVEMVSAVVFSSEVGINECMAWANKESALRALGYKLQLVQNDWKLFVREGPDLNSETVP